MKKVCLVTEEISEVLGSGGIGSAFFELAILLSKNNFFVDILYCPIKVMSESDIRTIEKKFIDFNIKFNVIEYSNYVEGGLTYEKKSYAIFQHLLNYKLQYDFIHFHDYKGLGFYTINSKNQGLAFLNAYIVLQMHGPTRWTIEANKTFFTHEDQLKIDFMERECAKKADIIVSPSQYLIDWLIENDFLHKNQKNIFVIKNVFSELNNKLFSKNIKKNKIKEIIFFGRHESRKGLDLFCNAIELIEDELLAQSIKVTFIGKFGKLFSQDSGIYLIDKTKNWKISIRLLTSLDRKEANAYLLRSDDSIVIIPSPIENSPYTVLESVALGKQTLISNAGGGVELLGSDSVNNYVFEPNSESIAYKILENINNKLPKPTLSESYLEISEKWINLHLNSKVLNKKKKSNNPKITIGITHFERTSKLFHAITSCIRQTYKNIEIIVVDDGSSDPAEIESLKSLEDFLHKVNGRIIYQKNAYLGAARNKIIDNADSDFIIFLDDDDLAMPDMVEKFVSAIENTGADAITSFNLFLDQSDRHLAVFRPEKYVKKPSYFPLGGPLSLGAIENCFGSATTIFNKKSLIAVGKYTELRNVGHEDYELFLKMVQNGYKVEVCPFPLYLYEVGRPGMALKTPMSLNFLRCFEALDIDINSRSWRDLINLNIGKSVSINEHNRTYWMNSKDHNGLIRNKLLTEESMVALDRLSYLIDDAQKHSAVSIFNALVEEKNRITGKLTNDSTSDNLSTISFDEFYSFDESNILEEKFQESTINSQVEFSLKRYDEALILLWEKIKNKLLINREELIYTKELLISLPKVSSFQFWKDLYLFFSKIKVSTDDQIHLLGVLFLISLYTENKKNINKLIQLVIEADEIEYLQQNPDVENALQSGDIISALNHYEVYGIYELNRSGFSRASEFCNLTSQFYDKEISSIKDMVEFFKI